MFGGRSTSIRCSKTTYNPYCVSLTNIKGKKWMFNNCLNNCRIIITTQCIEWFLNFFCTSFVEKNYLTQPRKWVDIRKHSSTWLRSRSAVGEISVRRGNILLIWIIFFCWWKLPLWWDLVEIIFPPRSDKFSHMNSPLIWDLICAILISTMFLTF